MREKGYKIILIACGLLFAAQLAGLIALQMLSPPLPQPDSKYTEEKATAILQYYEETVEAPEEGGKKPLEIFAATVEFSDYSKAHDNGYTSYFYNFDKYGKCTAFTSDGNRIGFEDEYTASGKSAIIDKIYEDIDSYIFIASNLQYDVPASDNIAKVYLSTNKGYYVREFPIEEYEQSCFAEIHDSYKIW